MMDKRSYTTCAQTRELLRDYIRGMMISNQDRLPGEEPLAEHLHVSRRTLHKALLKMEERGLLARDGRFRRYAQEYRNLARAGKILFLSVGRHYTFQLPAMERLWNMLHPLLLRHGADVRLFLNTVTRGLTMMKSAGVNANCKRQETADAIQLTITIPKS